MAIRAYPALHNHTCSTCGQLDEARVQACPSCSRKMARHVAISSIKKGQLIQRINTLVRELGELI